MSRLTILLVLWSAMGLCQQPELVAPQRHAGGILAIDADLKGQWFATLGKDGSVRVWSLPDATYLRSFPEKDARSLAVHPTGHKFAVGTDLTLSVMDAAKGTTVHRFENLPEYVNALAWSPDGSYILTGWNNLFRVDPETGASQQVATFVEQYGTPLRSIVVLPNNRVLAGSGNKVVLYDSNMTPWKTLATFNGPSSGQMVFAVNRAGTRLATAGSDLLLRFWSLADFKQAENPIKLGSRNPGSIVSALSFSADGTTVAAAVGVNLEIYDAETLASTALIPPEKNPPLDLMFPVPGKNIVLGGSLYGDVVALDANTFLPDVVRRANAGTRVRALANRTGGIDVAFAETAPFRTVGGVWRLGDEVRRRLDTTGTPIAFLDRWKGKPGEWTVSAINFAGSQLTIQDTNAGSRDDIYSGGWAELVTPDGQWAIGAGTDGHTLTALDLQSKKETQILPLGIAYRLALSPRGDKLAVSTDGAPVRVFSIPLWKELTPIEGVAKPRNSIGIWVATALAFSPNGETLGAAWHDGAIHVWNVASGHLDANITAGVGTVRGLAFRPDGLNLAAAGEAALAEWNVRTQKQTFAATDISPDFVAYPSSSRLIAASQDGVLSVFDEANHRKLGSFFLQDAEKGPWVAISPDGFFDASEGAYDELLWRFGGDTFNREPVERYFSDFYFPGVFGKFWKGAVPAGPRALDKISRNTPEVELHLNPPGNDPRLAEAEIAISGGSVQNLRLFRNGALIHQWPGASSARVHASVKLQAGPNEFTAYGFNQDHVRTPGARAMREGPDTLNRPGTLYVVAVGVDNYGNDALRLDFAGHDARMIGGMLNGGRLQLREMVPQMEKSGAGNSQYKDPRLDTWKGSSGPAAVTLLIDGQATKTAILSAIRDVGSKALPEDSFIFYFAGHGGGEGKRYYLAPSDLGFKGKPAGPEFLNAVRPKLISDLDLEAALEDLDVASGALIIDACDSGKAASAATDLRLGPVDSAGLAELAFEKDLWLLAASQGQQSALELKQQGYGLLTYILAEEELRKGKVSDDPLTNGIDLASWLEFAARRVPELHAGALAKRRDLTLETSKKIDVQRPSLLERQRPGAKPLQLAAYSVDLDPLSFTVTGGKETEPTKVAGLAAAPAEFRFTIRPGSGPGTFRPVTMSWSGRELDTAGLIEEKSREGRVAFAHFGAKTVTRDEAGSPEKLISGRKSPFLVTASGDDLHLWQSPTRGAAPVRMADPKSAVTFAASANRFAYCIPATPPAQGYQLWTATLPGGTPQVFASSATGECGGLEIVGANPPISIASQTLSTLLLHKAGVPGKVLATASKEDLSSFTASAFDLNGQVFAYATNSNVAIVTLNGSRPERHPTLANNGLITDMRFSPDGRWLASGDTEGGVALLGLNGKELVPVKLPPLAGGVQKLAFSDDSKLLAALFGDGRIQVYSIAQGTVLLRLTRFPDPAFGWLAETPDGRFDAKTESWQMIQRKDADGKTASLEEPSPAGYTPGLFAVAIAGH